MSEIIYKHAGKAEFQNAGSRFADIRWLGADDFPVFARHLALCGQKPVSEDLWREIYKNGTVYCGLFASGEMVARACCEIISFDVWEIADVRVATPHRNRGYAYAICRFVLQYITDRQKTPTIRTEDDNYPMRKVIDKLGFVPY